MNLFSYESKPMQILMRIGDLMILNAVFLLSCLPIVTIGAAQAGLYNAAKVLQDKEDDSSPLKAYFKGFTSGFFTITLVWGLLTILLVAVVLLSMTAYTMGAPVWPLVIAVVIVLLFQSLVAAFHSRFTCTPWQLIRNVWFLTFAHPLRSIGVALIVNLPLLTLIDAMFGIFKIVEIYTFMALSPVWLTLAFSTLFNFAYQLLKKPFKTLIDHYNETHNNTEATEEASEEPLGIE